jgi:FKBP-type peptidyl-prolyl cis-trans isomerase FkpA
MSILTQKTTKFSKKYQFSTIIGGIFTFLTVLCIAACSKSSVIEPDQMLAFAKKNNINYTIDPSGLWYEIIKPGTGTKPRATSTVSAAYIGTFMNEKIFDSTSKPIDFGLNGVIKGWTIGLQLIAPGGEIKLIIPSSLGYGPSDYSSIPGGSPLYFNVKLAAIKTY